MSSALTLLYTGLNEDSITGGYPLGNGYRLYLPSLMRFTALDASSPFDEGGANPYAYCEEDPIDRRDPTGHFFLPVGIAIVASATIALKLGLSLLVRKYGQSAKDWIENLPKDENIGAFNAEHEAAIGTDAARQVSSTGVGAISATQAARLRKMQFVVSEQLDRVEKSLAAAQGYRERRQLLRKGAMSSHDPSLARHLAFTEKENGFQELDSARNLINTIKSHRDSLDPELKRRLDFADRTQGKLRRDFDRTFLSNRSGD
ncbi:RHS repeat-associated core domain-containing protein [Trinickia diaoshuihuensis]|uniref:RHS repeat-associated core domain-containing protein n=1 Tax=Trinickia diaoshuihuensis TaxID=2292265 RepID=UPI000E282F7E|nr:RHS repeat-associated core domain-containing protein [Trinickia diaoshuihuensis]